MMRWLLVACVAFVAGGVTFRILSNPSSEPKPATTAAPRPKPPTAAPPAASPVRPSAPAEVTAIQKRLLEDDRLPPPPADAPVEVQRAYDHVIRSIQNNQDPLVKTPPASPDPAQMELFRRRLEERRKIASVRGKERGEAERKKVEERRAKMKAEREARVREMEMIRGPRPKAEPLGPPPQLGPPILNDDGTPMDLGSPPPPPAPPE